MIGSVLVVCVGNICRSPMGERSLHQQVPHLRLGSAGLSALVGQGADPMTSSVAAEVGLDLSRHVAKQLTTEIAADHDLILAMEQAHRIEIVRRMPHLSGRVMLFDHWIGGQGISDPYRLPEAIHRATRDRILTAAKAWAFRLDKKAR